MTEKVKKLPAVCSRGQPAVAPARRVSRMAARPDGSAPRATAKEKTVKRSASLSITITIATAVAAVIACPLLWCIAGAQGENAKAKDEEAIRRMVDDGIKAFNDRDVKALARTFHPDADFTNVI